MLTTASQFTPRVRSITTQHVAVTRALGVRRVPGVLQQHQSRAFRFGIWSSYLDVDFCREIRRRHRMMRHKYADRVNRRLSWDKHPFAEDTRHALKRMMNNYWHSHDARPGRRFYDDVEPHKQRTPDNSDGVRPGHNIEDVERGAMDHLIFGKNRRPVRRAQSVYHTFYGEPIEQEDYIIDPITNRKVPKYPTPSEAEDGVDIPIKTFKDYRSQFVHPDVIYKPSAAQGPVEDALSAEELQQFGHDVVDANPEDANATVRSYSEADPVLDSEDYVRTHDSAESKYRQLDESMLWDDASSVSASKSDDMHQYRPSLDDKTADGAGEPLKNDVFHNYRPSQHLESDRKAGNTTEERSHRYTDLHQYKTAMDGAREQFDDLKPPYEDMDRYRYKALEAEDVGKQFEDYKSNDTTQCQPTTDGNTSAIKDAESASNGDLEHCRTFRYNEFDNKPLGFTEESVKPEVLRNFQSSIERPEPGDFPESTVEDLRKKYGAAKLKRYTALRHLESDRDDGPFTIELSKLYDPLDEYESMTWNEHHGKPPPPAEELTEPYDPEELAKYKPFYWNEPAGNAISSSEKLSKSHIDLHDSNGPVPFNKPDGQLPSFSEEMSLEKRHNEARKQRGPSLWNEADKQPSQTSEELLGSLRRRADLYKNGAINDQGSERDGRPRAQEESSQDGLEASDVEKDYNSPEGVATGELDHANEPGPDVLRTLDQGKSNYREMLDSLMKQHERTSDAVDREVNLAVKSATAKTQQTGTPGRKLTGNYVRDFPEEFEKSWTQTLSSAPAETTEKSDHHEFQPEGENMAGGLEGAFGRPAPSKLQPALDRHVTEKTVTEHAGPCSKEHQDLETSSTDECTDSTQPSLVKQYGASADAKEAHMATAEEGRPAAVEGSSEFSHENASNLDDGPTLYKILAYDPVMQKVNMAETTSLVPDFTSALSPADALLRLSHPAKFFPHFASLEADGFEIVSGSGDVLVFRKVRAPTIKQETGSADTRTEDLSTTAEPEYTGSTVNPIDMTGRPRIMSPASANFASPTGYVAYDNLPESATSDLPPPPPPRIKYNINLRREEPVYSGPKYRTDGGQKKKSLGKRLLVGGVWVAGLSYGLGVVSEYFTTGGIDGMGPSGF